MLKGPIAVYYFETLKKTFFVRKKKKPQRLFLFLVTTYEIDREKSPTLYPFVEKLYEEKGTTFLMLAVDLK